LGLARPRRQADYSEGRDVSNDCYCDYEHPEFFERGTHTARTVHCCDECRRTISPGEKYEKVRGKWEGTFSVYKMCPRCIAFRDHLDAHIPCFCWSFGGMLAEAKDHIREIQKEACGSGLMFELGRLAVAIRRIPKFSAHLSESKP